MAQENLLDKQKINQQLLEGIDNNHPFIIAVIGSQIRGLVTNDSDWDIGGVFYYNRKNRCSIIKKPNTYTVKEVNNTTLIEVKHFFNHLLQHKPTAYELLCSDQVIYHHSIYSPNNLREQVFKRFDRNKLVNRIFKTGIAFLNNNNVKDFSRGVYFYLYGTTLLEAKDDFPANHWYDLVLQLNELKGSLFSSRLREIESFFDDYIHNRATMLPKLGHTLIMDMTIWRENNPVDHNEINLELRSYLEAYVSSIY